MALERPPYFALGLDLDARDGPAFARWVRMADAAGYDLISVTDHPYDAARHEAYSALAFALGMTERLSGYVGVTNLPLRPVPVLARSLSTLTTLSGGRIVFGIGAGGLWERITAFGAEPRSPGEAVAGLAEAIELVRYLTGGGTEPVDLDGAFSRVAQAVPAAAPTPPIWVGAMGPRALAVTGRLADGWIPGRGADWLAASYRESRTMIDDSAAAAGRDPTEVATVFNIAGRLTAADQPRTRDDHGRWHGGSIRQWADELTGATLEHGATGFNVTLTGPDGADENAARLFAEEVIPLVRSRT